MSTYASGSWPQTAGRGGTPWQLSQVRDYGTAPVRWELSLPGTDANGRERWLHGIAVTTGQAMAIAGGADPLAVLRLPPAVLTVRALSAAELAVLLLARQLAVTAVRVNGLARQRQARQPARPGVPAGGGIAVRPQRPCPQGPFQHADHDPCLIPGGAPCAHTMSWLVSARLRPHAGHVPRTGTGVVPITLYCTARGRLPEPGHAPPALALGIIGLADAAQHRALRPAALRGGG